MNEIYAQSEEFTLHCDIPQCTAQLSMVAGIARSEHNWGRISIYHDQPAPQDMDLCPRHYREMLAAIEMHRPPA